MGDVKKRDLTESDPILDEEDEATLAAIDRGIKAADRGRVATFEEAPRRLRKWLTKSSSQKTRS
jgi:predicted transcriptional regulator